MYSGSAAGLLHAEKQFRRIRGYKAMAKLLSVLDQQKVAENVESRMT